MPLIPALGKRSQADLCEFEASLVYRMEGRSPWSVGFPSVSSTLTSLAPFLYTLLAALFDPVCFILLAGSDRVSVGSVDNLWDLLLYLHHVCSGIPEFCLMFGCGSSISIHCWVNSASQMTIELGTNL
ncbi:hypothetical protein STEG23_033685, partial [Scotinomys teguina]